MATLYENFVTQLLTTISIEHQRVHQGNFYFTTMHWDNIGNTDTILYLIPNNGYHLQGIVASLSSGEVMLKMWENPTIQNIGNVLPAINLNRNSDKISKLKVYEGSSFITMGNELFQFPIYGNKKSGEIGNSVFPEIILNGNNTYALTINTVSTTGNVNLQLTYYNSDNI